MQQNVTSLADLKLFFQSEQFKPLSRTTTRICISSSPNTITFLGMSEILTGTTISRSIGSLSTDITQYVALRMRKNKKIRNSLFSTLSRESLTASILFNVARCFINYFISALVLQRRCMTSHKRLLHPLLFQPLQCSLQD